MNTKILSKHYGALSPAERLSLLMAAGARGDDVEHARVVGAAAWETWRVPDTFGRALAFLAVFSPHRMERLELAALFFKMSALADAAAGDRAARYGDAARLYGYLVRVHGDAWARFCEAESLDPGVCEAVAPGNRTLEVAAGEADERGFTDAEAWEYVRRGAPDAPNALKTAESVAAELRAAFAFLLDQWT